MSVSSIISGFTNFFKTREFCYFDQQNQLQTVSFNFIYCIFRRLGYYKETHLKNVVSQGYVFAFKVDNKEAYNTEKKEILLLKLTAKVQKMQNSIANPFYANLEEITMKNGTVVQIQGRFVFDNKDLNSEIPRVDKIEIRMHSYLGSRTIEFSKSKIYNIEVCTDFLKTMIAPIPNPNKEILDEAALGLVSDILANTNSMSHFFCIGNDSVENIIAPFGWKYSRMIYSPEQPVRTLLVLRKKPDDQIRKLEQQEKRAKISLDFVQTLLKRDMSHDY